MEGPPTVMCEDGVSHIKYVFRIRLFFGPDQIAGRLMQLTQFSDYSLRLVLYLATHEDQLVTLQEVSQAYGVSQHHLVKVAARLIEEGIVSSVRGRNGGLRLN